MAELIRGVVFLSAALQVLVALCSACSFTVYNNCPHTIWPATLAGAGTPQLPTTGFRLAAGESAQIPASLGWSGRIWARTGCFFDEHGEGTCQTGDCGGKLQCGGMAALPPATLFEITLATSSSTRDFYDVSLVDGYNLPVYAAPRGSAAACNATGCISDLNSGMNELLKKTKKGSS